MTPANLFYYSLLVFIGIFSAMLLCFAGTKASQKRLNSPHHSLEIKSSPVFYFMRGASFIAAFSIIGMGASGIWYAVRWIAPLFTFHFTPGRLAIVSIVIGVFPLAVGLLASLIARLLGCQLNEGGVSECKVWGRDIGPLLYAMFVFTWMTMFTMGFAVFGIIGSVIWAFMR